MYLPVPFPNSTPCVLVCTNVSLSLSLCSAVIVIRNAKLMDAKRIKHRTHPPVSVDDIEQQISDVKDAILQEGALLVSFNRHDHWPVSCLLF
jgi:hypothetical protein